jgi:hypothetical protein
LVPQEEEMIRLLTLKGYTLEKELYFTISVGINQREEEITTLDIKSSPWSHPEITSLLTRYIPHFQTYGRVKDNLNIQMGITALSTYSKLSVQRNTTFACLALDFPSLLPSSQATVLSTVSRKGKEVQGRNSLPPSRLQHLFRGERHLTFQRGSCCLTVRWDISFDEVGFAQSEVTLENQIPESCMS